MCDMHNMHMPCSQSFLQRYLHFHANMTNWLQQQQQQHQNRNASRCNSCYCIRNTHYPINFHQEALPTPGCHMALSNPGCHVPLPNPGCHQALPNPGCHQALPNPGCHQALPTPGYHQALPTPGYHQALPTPGYHQAVPVPGIQDPNNRNVTASFSDSSSESYSEEDFEHVDYEDDDDECEYELNVDAILAMRAAKEELSSTDESDSFELVNSPKEGDESENSSIVEPVKRPDVTASIKNEKENLEYLYGNQSSTIAGLETAMNLNFDRYCDMNQPTMWPVLPLRLS